MLHVDKLEGKNRTCNHMRGGSFLLYFERKTTLQHIRCGRACANYAALDISRLQVGEQGWD